MNNLPPFSLSSSQQPPTRGPALRRHLCPRSLRLAGCLLGLGLFACSPRSVVEEEAPSPPAEQLSSDAEEVPILDDQKAPALPHDTWLPISTIAAPEARVRHSAVWTGTEMIVWGGEDEKNLEINTGGRYDPRTDTWKPLSTEGAPHRRSEHSAVWTGEEMIVWGGATSHFEDVAELLPEQGTIYFDTGARYEPRTDTWREMSVVGAPEGRVRHGAIWTGSEMIVWGGTGSHGARYDPKTDQWRPIATQGAHPYYNAYLLAWTGSELLVWSGDTWNIDERNTKQFSGARYRPGTDTWFSITEPSKLSPSLQFSVWTGQEVIVAAATRGVSGVLSVEAYRPEHDTWRFINQEGAPSGLVGARAVWTGEELIVWQGRKGEGGLYEPSTDQWRPISTESAPPNFWNTTVWTGEEMIVWGGRVSGASGRSPTVNTGARYWP